MKNALITGCAGFIGGHLSRQFLEMGWKVVGMDNLSRPGAQMMLAHLGRNGHFKFHHTDVRDWKTIATVFQKEGPFDAVIHQAAQVAVTTSIANPREDFEVNAQGTLNLLEATRLFTPNSVFMVSSTNKVYGDMKFIVIEEQQSRYCYEKAYSKGIDENFSLDFSSPYGCSKGAADQYTCDYRRIYGLKSFVFRQSCIYGTWQFGMEDQGWVAWFVIAGLFGKPVTIFGDGKQVRDLLWIDDLVQLYVRVYELADSLEDYVFNVGGGACNTLSLLELVEILRSNGVLPNQPAFEPWRPGDQRVFISNIKRVTQATGWKPTVAPHKGVIFLEKWVRQNKALLGSALRLE
jgi:CDP-paratose 2-epimerase